uniref:Fibronectin type-III domain-containing protein n=1 Tax=Meloidogyne floridensis TaxID=298350 RepID=A0A915NNH6_9BILA
MALLMLPLITFVAFRDGAANIGNNKHSKQQQNNLLFLENLKIINGTELILECPPASILVRQHMAPDFEHPQLVRKLNWFFEGVLVASFQQQELGADIEQQLWTNNERLLLKRPFFELQTDPLFAEELPLQKAGAKLLSRASVRNMQELGADIEQQLWTNNERLLLKRPFFELRIFPVLPKDNGEWICILETDPLFAEELPLQKAGAKLLVLEKPPIPPKPSIQFGNNKNSVLLDWSKGFLPLPSQQPIIKFAIYISQKFEENIKRRKNNNFVRVLSTKNNLTNLEIAELEPNTLYSFSVRAENTVGESQFGPEAVFRTFGLPPSKSPEIRSLINSSSPDCVELEWQQPVIVDDGEESTSDSILGYRIIVNKLDGTNLKEIYAKGSNTQKQLVCSLQPFTDYSLTLEAHNLFGYSKATKTSFKTEQWRFDKKPPIPPKPSIQYGSNKNSVLLDWSKGFLPLPSQQPIIKFAIYISQKFEENIKRRKNNNFVRVLSTKNNLTNLEIAELEPNTLYSFSVRAENTVGESQFGPEAVFKTFGLPPSKSAEIRSLINSTSADCVELEWQQPIIEEDGEESTSDSILGYRIIVNKLDGTNLKEIYAKGSNTQKQLVCSLEPFTDYSLTLEAHNLFGYSKATKTSFKTEQSIPSGPPLSVQVLPLPGGTSLSLNWRQPEKPNGIIRAYLIHFKEMFSQRPLRQIRLEAKNEEENDEELFNRDQLKQSSSNTVFAF